jgi:hypothetical protein
MVKLGLQTLFVEGYNLSKNVLDVANAAMSTPRADVTQKPKTNLIFIIIYKCIAASFEIHVL